jgi:hypothetical protein
MAQARKDVTPPYGYLIRLFRPFPDFDPPFIKPVRRKAVELLNLKAVIAFSMSVVDRAAAFLTSFTPLANQAKWSGSRSVLRLV